MDINKKLTVLGFIILLSFSLFSAADDTGLSFSPRLSVLRKGNFIEISPRAALTKAGKDMPL